jgi:hypothetical protein
LVQDNADSIRAILGPVDHGRASDSSSSSGCGCTVGKRRVHTNVAMLFSAAAMLLLARTLRRRRARA